MLNRLTPSIAALALIMSMPAAAQVSVENLVPTYGSHDLASGFEPDPFTVKVVAGGDVDASEYLSSCSGFVARTPDVRINYTAGSQYPLIIGAISESDTTLVVIPPEQTMNCDDDSWGDGDPIMTFKRPQSGIYLIWVGASAQGESPAAVVVVSESTRIINPE